MGKIWLPVTQKSYLSNIVSPGERVSFRNFYDKSGKLLYLLSMGHRPTPELSIVVIMNDVSKFSVCVMGPIQRDVCMTIDLALPHGLNWGRMVC